MMSLLALSLGPPLAESGESVAPPIQRFYDSLIFLTSPPSLPAAMNWSDPDSYCGLPWVFCDRVNGAWARIAKMDLRGFQDIKLNTAKVTEPLLAINKQSPLRSLSFSGMHFEGSLPVSWSQLTGLQLLYLQSSASSKLRLTGVLPTSWSSLTQLRELALHHNALKGTLPAAWSAMTALQKLWLNNNRRLYGGIPQGWPLALTELRQLTLSGTAVCGPTSFLPSVLQAHNGTGYSVYALPTCPALSIFLALGRPASLQVPGQYQFCGLAWLPCGRCPQAQDEKLPPQQCQWGSKLLLSDFIAARPTSLDSLTPALIMINVAFDVLAIVASDFRLQGTLPPSWAALRALITVQLDANQIWGSLPPQWSALTRLTTLSLSYNQLSGNLPESYSKLSRLTGMYLDTNQLSGTLPPSWSRLTNLTSLWLNSNSLYGPLPRTWSSLTGLQVLALSDNQLSGTLPPSWANLTGMYAMLLDSNALEGTLPPQWGSMQQLEGLWLMSNMLSGPLPPSWSTMTAMTSMLLTGNRLVGTLPPEWGSFTHIKLMWLASQALSGTVPATWATWQQPVQLDVSGTDVCGALPAKLVGRTTPFRLPACTAERLRGAAHPPGAAGGAAVAKHAKVTGVASPPPASMPVSAAACMDLLLPGAGRRRVCARA